MDFVHEGRDRIRRMTRIRFGVEPDRIDVEDALATAVFRVHLEPYQTRLLVVSVEPILGTEDDRAAPNFDHAVHELRRSYEEWERESTQIVTDNELFNQLLDRSLRDLRALYTRVGDGGVLAAGIPWYVTIFWRSIRVRHARRSSSWPLARARRRTTGGTSSRARSCTRSATASSRARGSCRTRPTSGRWTPRRGS